MAYEDEEFGRLHENAAELGVDLPADLVVERRCVELEPGEHLSYIRWSEAEPEVVFLHGGGQNAHTWDSVILALGRPAVAIDLPGHGHSYRRADRDYGPWRNVEAVADALPRIASRAAAVVGMSLGGATTIRLAAERPDLCRRAAIIDVTPQVNDPSRSMTTMERGSVALIAGPPTYGSLEEMAEAAVALSPLRAPEGVRRGVWHNAYQRADGTWGWRYDLFGPLPEGASWPDFTTLWDDVSRIRMPVLFVRGGESRYVLDEDVDQMRARLPDLRVEVVDGAGHAVQSDRPLELVRLLRSFLDS